MGGSPQAQGEREEAASGAASETYGSGQGLCSPVGFLMVAVNELLDSGWVAAQEKVSPRFHCSAQPGSTLVTL